MKLEVGMYVRTEKGIIDKIINVKEETEMNYIVGNTISINTINVKTENGTTVPLSTKASYNIIDLIEVGDYVNGEKIEEIGNRKLYYDCCDTGYKKGFIHCDEIETIVTKEQFESLMYKVGE